MKIKPEIIIEKVTEYYSSNQDSLNTKCRGAELVKCRQIIMYFMREYTKLSLSRIGAYYYRDHATVLHACKQVNNLCFSDKCYREEIRTIRNILSRCAEYQPISNIPPHYNTMGLIGKQINCS